VGIFSFFGKKNSQQAVAAKSSARKKNEMAGDRLNSGSDLGRTQLAQRNNAYATAMKIDAIESEMSSEFKPVMPSSKAIQPPPHNTQISLEASITTRPPEELLSIMGSTTELLLGSETIAGRPAKMSSFELASVVEESAILFANGQLEIAEQLLRNGIEEDTLGHETPIAWAMLFDLHQINGNRAEFDRLSIEYTSKFETSPPTWIEPNVKPETHQAIKNVDATVSFVGMLDGKIVKQLEYVQTLAEQKQVVQLEFDGITGVNPVGCGILLRVLTRLQKSGNDLVLVGALNFTKKIRAILAVGRRAETEAPWLLLLEILRLLNLEKYFEEISIDYCITFEVSPPAFVAPVNKVMTAKPDTRPNSDHFLMPEIVDSGVDQLIKAIVEYAQNRTLSIIDCSHLVRVNFNAAGQLIGGLAPIVEKGAMIELHHVNHLVVALFNTVGMPGIVRILPRNN
jgi:ABC-type transporter Mla MlaB component